MKPKVIVRGRDPNCVHYSDIVGTIGTCRECGQVVDYRPCQEGKNELLAAKGRKGGKAYAAIYSD